VRQNQAQSIVGEFEDISLGDKRLDRKLLAIVCMSEMHKTGHRSLAALSDDAEPSDAAQTPEAMLASEALAEELED
jgi:hypothetical protein